MAHLTRLFWTPEQTARLEQLRDSGASAVRAAAALGRKVNAVSLKAKKLGKPFPNQRKARSERAAKEAAARQREL
jgi:hypothetical protein